MQILLRCVDHQLGYAHLFQETPAVTIARRLVEVEDMTAFPGLPRREGHEHLVPVITVDVRHPARAVDAETEALRVVRHLDLQNAAAHGGEGLHRAETPLMVTRAGPLHTLRPELRRHDGLIVEVVALLGPRVEEMHRPCHGLTGLADVPEFTEGLGVRVLAVGAQHEPRAGFKLATRAPDRHRLTIEAVVADGLQQIKRAFDVRLALAGEFVANVNDGIQPAPADVGAVFLLADLHAPDEIIIPAAFFNAPDQRQAVAVHEVAEMVGDVLRPVAVTVATDQRVAEVMQAVAVNRGQHLAARHFLIRRGIVKAEGVIQTHVIALPDRAGIPRHLLAIRQHDQISASLHAACIAGVLLAAKLRLFLSRHAAGALHTQRPGHDLARIHRRLPVRPQLLRQLRPRAGAGVGRAGLGGTQRAEIRLVVIRQSLRQKALDGERDAALHETPKAQAARLGLGQLKLGRPALLDLGLEVHHAGGDLLPAVIVVMIDAQLRAGPTQRQALVAHQRVDPRDDHRLVGFGGGLALHGCFLFAVRGSQFSAGGVTKSQDQAGDEDHAERQRLQAAQHPAALQHRHRSLRGHRLTGAVRAVIHRLPGEHERRA